MFALLALLEASRSKFLEWQVPLLVLFVVLVNTLEWLVEAPAFCAIWEPILQAVAVQHVLVVLREQLPVPWLLWSAPIAQQAVMQAAQDLVIAWLVMSVVMQLSRVLQHAYFVWLELPNPNEAWHNATVVLLIILLPLLVNLNARDVLMGHMLQAQIHPLVCNVLQVSTKIQPLLQENVRLVQQELSLEEVDKPAVNLARSAPMHQMLKLLLA